MRRWLVNHAIQNVWAKPNLDAQMVCELQLLSSRSLTKTLINLSGDNLMMPDNTHSYGVYDLGAFHPNRGVLNIDYHEGWVSLEELVNRTGACFFFYNIDGVVLPARYIYIARTISDRFLVSIRQDLRFMDLREGKVFCKLYDHFALNNEPEGSYTGVQVETLEVTNEYESNNFILRYNNLKQSILATEMVVNGIKVSDPSVSDIPTGSYAEIVTDDTVYKKHTFNVADLPSFMSELDKTKKYLLHLPKDGQFQYADDIELVIRVGNKGRYYHRHNRAALTQLTHGDFAIATKHVTEYAPAFADWVDVKIDLFVRHSGINREVLFNHNRIHELYQLDDIRIETIMTGLNSHLPFWQAAQLEISAINYLRSSQPLGIDHKLVSDTYGYNAALYYAADTPTKVRPDLVQRTAKLPPLLESNSMGYEYDAEGRLLGWWKHTAGDYICRRSATELVEAIPGNGGEVLDVVYGADEILLERYVNYRFYLQKIKDGVALQEYIDVTDTDHYEIQDTFKVKWNYDEVRYRPVVLSDKTHLIYKESVAESEGLIRVAVKHKIEGVGSFPSPFKFATVEVFLNSRPLVYGIDYLMDWPAITITNKTYIIPGSSQEVVVRARVPAKDLEPPKTGFIANGLLSENSQYDVKDDKIIRIVFGGGIHHRDDVKFREDMAVKVDSQYNGLPYSIDSVAVPAEDILEGGYVQRRLDALERDKLVEDFLTIHNPKPLIDDIQPIENRYQLYSPIMNKIILDVESGMLMLTDDDPTFRISTQQLDKIMANYDHLLPSDPAFTGFNEWFVVVEPHWGFGTKEVTALLYTLLERINHRYFRNRIALSHYLTIRNY